MEGGGGDVEEGGDMTEGECKVGDGISSSHKC